MAINPGFIDLEPVIPIIRTIVVIIFLITVFNFLLRIVKKHLLNMAKTKKQISNVKIFSRIFSYLFVLILVFFAFFSYTGSWTGLGLTMGLFSAALGWALQKPITGIAAWIMIVWKRPFEIGDRIIIGNVRGDVSDITLAHIYVKEIGGIVPGEENSGRLVMIPNCVVFEQNIINYTSKDEFVLDQVAFIVTFDSNLDKAKTIAVDAARKYTRRYLKVIKILPYIRVFFQPSGMKVQVRYYCPAKSLQEMTSKITQGIFNSIKKTKSVEFAYPHTEVVLRKKK